MQKQFSKRAVIYCRVSTTEQVIEGNSLSTQEKLCRDYATKNGYEVVETYIEQGESAKTTLRTELQKMMVFCSNKRNAVGAVIFYKIDRLSRNTDDYCQLRLLFKKYGVEIKSVSEHFENNPAGRFMENIMANVAQFDNDIRAERCAGGMRDATRDGRYVWMAPVGYDNVHVNGKATIAQNPITAPLVREAFELVSKNIYPVEEVRRIISKRGLVLRKGTPIAKQYFYQMLKKRIYMGIIDKFGETHKGSFEPIVTEKIFEQVQRVLKHRGNKTKQYKLDNEDFPLRRFVFNSEGQKITGSWCQGRHKKYPRYRFMKEPGMKGSGYSKDDLELQFMKYMDQFRLDEALIEKLRTKLKEGLSGTLEDEQKDVRKLRTKVEELTVRQNTLIKKNLDGYISDMILKQQLDIIEKEMTESQTYLASLKDDKADFKGLLDHTEKYLKNPSIIWKNATFEQRIKLQWFQFPRGIVIKNKKLYTSQIPFVFKTKEAFLPPLSAVVDLSGLEPLTSALQMRRSNQMS